MICAYFFPDSDETTFSLKKVILWIAESKFEVKNVLMMDLFLTNIQFFTSQDANWWTGVMWITCGLLWCFYQLFGLSFWRHPFTAEDQSVSKRCNAKFLQICSDEETNSSTSWMTWGWVNVFIFIFGWIIPLKVLHEHYAKNNLCFWECDCPVEFLFWSSSWNYGNINLRVLNTWLIHSSYVILTRLFV